jgi:hypothetical protein
MKTLVADLLRIVPTAVVLVLILASGCGSSVVGLYESVDTESLTLELKADGTYRIAFSVNGYDTDMEGKYRVEGGCVVTDPDKGAEYKMTILKDGLSGEMDGEAFEYRKVD